MENFDNFYEIGMGFISNSVNYKSKYPENDLLFLKNDNTKPSNEETTDGRNRNEFSIIFKPDEKIPIPDTTGNGVATEGLDTKHYGEDVDVNAVQAKSEMNNLINIFLYLKSLLLQDIQYIKIENLEITQILFNNTIKLNPKTKIDHSFIKLFNKYSLSQLVDKMIYTLSTFDPTRTEDFIDEYFIDNIYKLTNIELYGSDFSNFRFNEIFGTDFNKINDIINDVVKASDIINSTNFKDLCDNKTKLIKNNFKNYDNRSSILLKQTVDKLYITAIRIQSFVESLLSDIRKYIDYIRPTQPKIIKFPTPIFTYGTKIDPWISSDYHLLKELLHGGSKDNTERTEKIIEMHNKLVKPDDEFLFLGDISESEFFDNKQYVNSWIFDKLKNCCKRLNGRKILLIGNNDTGSDEFYKECGFKEIYHDPIITDKFIFSHGPINTISNKLNIHGHIHGNKHYWNIDFHNHIDAYYGLWGSPVKLSYLTKKQIQSFYYNGCTIDKSECEDPELLKKPFNIN